jgi:hypothetical protein
MLREREIAGIFPVQAMRADPKAMDYQLLSTDYVTGVNIDVAG